MGIVTACKNVIFKSTALRITARNTRNTLKMFRFKSRGASVKTDEKTLIFGAYNGKNYACSPKAVYEYMVSNDEFSDYRFVWMFDEPEKYSFLLENRNTEIVRTKTAECERVLHEAKYWIFNFRALDHWIPKDDQVYVQCWHGTPLKRLGYDITTSDNAMNSIGEIRSKYKIDAKRFDYMVSPCSFVTEKFGSAWNLKAFGKSNAILEIGYPRNDFLKTYSEEDVRRVKKSLGLENCDKKLILYAPTWRDNQHDAAKGYVYDNPVDFDLLQQQLGDDYIILFRAHYLVADNFDFGAYEGFIYDVSKYDDINELYIIADLLITDYSSVFFDYAILEKPMFFYMYDMDEYRDEMRGFYLDVNELPGPIVKTEMDLVSAIRTGEKEGAPMDQIREFNEEYNRMNDGKAAERLTAIVVGK